MAPCAHCGWSHGARGHPSSCPSACNDCGALHSAHPDFIYSNNVPSVCKPQQDPTDKDGAVSKPQHVSADDVPSVCEPQQDSADKDSAACEPQLDSANKDPTVCKPQLDSADKDPTVCKPQQDSADNDCNDVSRTDNDASVSEQRADMSQHLLPSSTKSESSTPSSKSGLHEIGCDDILPKEQDLPRSCVTPESSTPHPKSTLREMGSGDLLPNEPIFPRPHIPPESNIPNPPKSKLRDDLFLAEQKWPRSSVPQRSSIRPPTKPKLPEHVHYADLAPRSAVDSPSSGIDCLPASVSQDRVFMDFEHHSPGLPQQPIFAQIVDSPPRKPPTAMDDNILNSVAMQQPHLASRLPQPSIAHDSIHRQLTQLQFNSRQLEHFNGTKTSSTPSSNYKCAPDIHQGATHHHHHGNMTPQPLSSRIGISSTPHLSGGREYGGAQKQHQRQQKMPWSCQWGTKKQKHQLLPSPPPVPNPRPPQETPMPADLTSMMVTNTNGTSTHSEPSVVSHTTTQNNYHAEEGVDVVEQEERLSEEIPQFLKNSRGGKSLVALLRSPYSPSKEKIEQQKGTCTRGQDGGETNCTATRKKDKGGKNPHSNTTRGTALLALLRSPYSPSKEKIEQISTSTPPVTKTSTEGRDGGGGDLHKKMGGRRENAGEEKKYDDIHERNGKKNDAQEEGGKKEDHDRRMIPKRPIFEPTRKVRDEVDQEGIEFMLNEIRSQLDPLLSEFGKLKEAYDALQREIHADLIRRQKPSFAERCCRVFCSFLMLLFLGASILVAYLAYLGPVEETVPLLQLDRPRVQNGAYDDYNDRMLKFHSLTQENSWKCSTLKVVQNGNLTQISKFFP